MTTLPYVYMILVDEDMGSDDYTDEEFMLKAHNDLTGKVFSIKHFQDWLNYEDEDKNNYYIRFIQ